MFSCGRVLSLKLRLSLFVCPALLICFRLLYRIHGSNCIHNILIYSFDVNWQFLQFLHQLGVAVHPFHSQTVHDISQSTCCLLFTLFSLPLSLHCLKMCHKTPNISNWKLIIFPSSLYKFAPVSRWELWNVKMFLHPTSSAHEFALTQKCVGPSSDICESWNQSNQLELISQQKKLARATRNSQPGLANWSCTTFACLCWWYRLKPWNASQSTEIGI